MLPDVVLPGRAGQSVTAIIMEAPFVVLSLFTEDLETRAWTVSIKVYSVSPSNLMEKISSQGTLLKNIPVRTGTMELRNRVA